MPVHVLTDSTLNLRFLPLSVGLAVYHRGVSLSEARVALVADDGVDRVVLLPIPIHAGVLNFWRCATQYCVTESQLSYTYSPLYFSMTKPKKVGALFCQCCHTELHQAMHTWAFFAGERQVVVAGHVVPLALLMPDHHHTVLP